MIQLFRNSTLPKIISTIVIVAFLLPLVHYSPILVAILVLMGVAYFVYRCIKWYKKRSREIVVAIDVQRFKEKQDDATYH